MAVGLRTRKKSAPASKVAKKRASKKASLATYQAMRDFDKTAEPSGKQTKQGLPDNAFLIQKHAATRLHYDFRIALDGVLKSWAVTKGPSLDPNDKRLAVEVEDHPLDYGTFEGTIPKGQYGGGTVMLWDRGTWTPVGDPHESLRKGHLKFDLDGERLKGRFVLVRMGGRAAREKKPNWLLIKERDGLEREGGDAVTDTFTTSVASDRAMEQIASDVDRVWQSNRAREPEQPAVKPRKIAGAKAAKLPDFVPVQLATRVKAPPKGDDWLHEIKFDGYRTQLRFDRGRVQFLTRRGLDWSERFAGLVEPATELPATTALIDGEIVVLDKQGVSDFGALQAYLSEGKREQLLYYAFDLLHLDGQDLTKLPLEARKEALRKILPRTDGPIRFSDHVTATGEEFYSQACRLALEGVISKRRDAPYRSGRGDSWVKSKCVERQEFIIGGWTPPSDRTQSVGSLLLGVYDGDRLVYVGKVGTGFTRSSGADLRKRLDKLKTDKHPFDRKPPDSRDARFVKPDLVAEIEYLTMTRDRILRHASFKGLREDKEARSVTMEAPKETKAKAAPAKTASTKAAPIGVRKGDALMIAGARITHPDRRIDEESGLTKEGLAEYLALVADRMLPHIAGRPLSIVRCPEGSGKPCFYQKHVGRGVPPGVKSVTVPDKSGTDEYLMIDDVQGLLGLAQMGALEIHPWGARGDAPDKPDRLIFDFDPDPDLPYQRVIDGAVALRARLDDLGLESFVKTTGGKGLHVVVPIQRKHPWPVIKEFARAVATAVAKDDPGFVVTMTKAKRTGKIFLDFFRNDRGATAVAPYSTRARPGAPIATPLFWDELSPRLPPNHFTVENLPRRLAQLKEDPWAKMLTSRQGITAKMLTALKVKA
ncbi:DNA ligase D [Roseiterribacter gracilis]|uniref:DNA ligase (ATP) n=1 Tax=Roseiterribacter gracilis TaxID=2812848 RepID=A0A8S8X8U9_9PROT|nr:ATP-dependent DNA ligase [Rhodospirillales bacterium TMPK1]